MILHNFQMIAKKVSYTENLGVVDDRLVLQKGFLCGLSLCTAASKHLYPSSSRLALLHSSFEGVLLF